jgi:D-methionine transport system substrate-binding protein
MKKLILVCVLSLFCFVAACTNKNTIDDKRIVIAASEVPHAEILEVAREFIENCGYTLEIKIFSDYIIQNQVTVSGEVDANFFQHQPYLDDFNLNNNANLVSVLQVHFEPLGLYQGRRKSLNDLENAKIAIANDTSNGARGLLLLESLGIIKLDHTKGFNVDASDIIENKYHIQILELDAAIIPVQLPDLDFAVINGNYALEANLSKNTLLASEDKESDVALLYSNIIVVKEEYKNKEAIEVLVNALKQEKVSNFIKNNYQGVVIPIN